MSGSFRLILLAHLFILPTLAYAQPVPVPSPSPADQPELSPLLYIDTRFIATDWPQICQGANASIHAYQPAAPPIRSDLPVQLLDDLHVDFLIRETQKAVTNRTVNHPRYTLPANESVSWELHTGSSFSSMSSLAPHPSLMCKINVHTTPAPNGRVTLRMQIQLLPRPGQAPPATPVPAYQVTETSLTFDVDPSVKPTICVLLPFTTQQIRQTYETIGELDHHPLPPNAVLLLKINPVQPEPPTPGPAVPNLRTLPQTP